MTISFWQAGVPQGQTSAPSVSYGIAAPSIANNRHYLVVTAHRNIAQTTDGASGEVVSVADTLGYWSWFKMGEWCNGQGAAGVGVIVSMWLGRPVKEDAQWSVINATFSGTAASAKIVAHQIHTTYGTIVWAEPKYGVTDNATYASLATGTMTERQYLIVRGEGVYTSSGTEESWTKSTDWADLNDGVGNNLLMYGERKGTGELITSETSAPTGASANAHVGMLAILYEGDLSRGNPFMGVGAV